MATQQIVSAPANAAIFLTLTVRPGRAVAVRDQLAELPELTRAVSFRHNDAELIAVVGLGSEMWGRMTSARKPKDLHPFPELRGAKHAAPSTPGDVFLHVRGREMGMCWELARIVLAKLGGDVEVEDEVQGFRYFDNRDFLGFVDGTENPEGSDAERAVRISAEEDPDYAGGSYVHVQRYRHLIEDWEALSTEEQERVIGRTKLDDVELEDDAQPDNSHVALNDVEDDDGEDQDIFRLNMPFGSLKDGEVGTFFIGYSGRTWVTEQMLKNMFLGSPEGNYDRILDFSIPETGTLFFIPSVAQLEGLADLPAPGEPAEDDGDGGEEPEPPAPPAGGPERGLGIGGLRATPDLGREDDAPRS